MTPRTYWDRELGLWQEDPGNHARLKPLWDGHYGVWVLAGKYESRRLVEAFLGPLVASS